MRDARLVSILIGLSFAASASPLFTITDIGTLGGGAAAGFSVNSSGQVVGSSQSPDQSTRAISYSGGVFSDVTPLFASGGEARSINGQGQIAGTTYIDGRPQATAWQNGTATTLGDLGGGESYGMAVDDSGTVVGMAATANGEGHMFAYENGVMRDLGAPNGADWASPYGVNANGQVIGTSMNSAGRFSAFLWSEEDGYVVLGTLGGRCSYANSINDDGEIVGHALTRSGYAHAFSYSDGVMHDLGTLGGTSSYAYGINGSGAAVGYSLLANGLTHAFLFDGGVMLDLNAMFGGGSGWELTGAYGINDAGQIVGSGLLNGLEHAFLLNPVASSPVAFRSASMMAPVPEPGTGVLIALGLCVGLAWHYRRTRSPARARCESAADQNRRLPNRLGNLLGSGRHTY